MEFNEVVRSRRSVRKFSSRAVSDETLRNLIETALHAPSSMNGQPWLFVIIRDPKIKKQIVDLKNRYCPPEKKAFSANFLLEAQALIVTCIDKSKAHDRGIESGVLATGHLLLAAASHGLSTVYLSAYQADRPELAQEFRRILGIPAEVDPLTLVPVGYPGEAPPPKSLPSPDAVIFHDTFGKK